MNEYFEIPRSSGNGMMRWFTIDIPWEDRDLLQMIQAVVTKRAAAAVNAERWEDAKRYATMLNDIMEVLTKANG